MAVATAALEEGIIHAGLQSVLPGPRVVLRPELRVLAGRTAADTARSICATPSSRSCNVYFYTVGNMVGIEKIHKWGDAARPWRKDRH